MVSEALFEQRKSSHRAMDTAPDSGPAVGSSASTEHAPPPTASGVSSSASSASSAPSELSESPEFNEESRCGAKPGLGPHTTFACGLLAGVVQAGVFNPYDRALYLSVKNKRRFLSAENWRRPYLGFAQSVGGRAVSGGLFFPLESTIRSAVVSGEDARGGARSRSRTRRERRRSDVMNFLVGSLAGSVNALFLNPLSAIKYRTWGREENRGMFSEAAVMWRKAGPTPFFHGFLPTVCRDVVFGGTYTLLRKHLRERNDHGQARNQPHGRQWIWDMGAAAVATVVSGPFNLARNVQFATGASKQRPSVVMILNKLWTDASEKGRLLGFLGHVQRRLRIGWGTFRVAVGMAFGQKVYDSFYAMATEQRT